MDEGEKYQQQILSLRREKEAAEMQVSVLEEFKFRSVDAVAGA